MKGVFVSQFPSLGPIWQRFPSLNFLPFFNGSSSFYSRYFPFPFCLPFPFFRVVVSYGALIATLWVTVSIESLVTVPGKTQTPRVCGIALPLFPETGVSSAYISGQVLVPGRAIVSSRAIVSGRATFASTLRLHHLIEVSRTRAEVVAWPTWCLYVLNTSPPVSGLVSVMREE